MWKVVALSQVMDEEIHNVLLSLPTDAYLSTPALDAIHIYFLSQPHKDTKFVFFSPCREEEMFSLFQH